MPLPNRVCAEVYSYALSKHGGDDVHWFGEAPVAHLLDMKVVGLIHQG